MHKQSWPSLYDRLFAVAVAVASPSIVVGAILAEIRGAPRWLLLAGIRPFVADGGDLGEVVRTLPITMECRHAYGRRDGASIERRDLPAPAEGTFYQKPANEP